MKGGVGMLCFGGGGQGEGREPFKGIAVGSATLQLSRGCRATGLNPLSLLSSSACFGLLIFQCP